MKLVFSVAEAAAALGVSDVLIYELTERGELPWLRLGPRKVLPVRAIEAVLDEGMDDLKPSQAPTSFRTLVGEELPP